MNASNLQKSNAQEDDKNIADNGVNRDLSAEAQHVQLQSAAYKDTDLAVNKEFQLPQDFKDFSITEYEKKISSQKYKVTTQIDEINKELKEIASMQTIEKAVLKEKLLEKKMKLELIKEKESALNKKESKKRVLEKQNHNKFVKLEDLLEDYESISLEKINRVHEQEEKIKFNFLRNSENKIQTILNNKQQILNDIKNELIEKEKSIKEEQKKLSHLEEKKSIHVKDLLGADKVKTEDQINLEELTNTITRTEGEISSLDKKIEELTDDRLKCTAEINKLLIIIEKYNSDIIDRCNEEKKISGSTSNWYIDFTNSEGKLIPESERKVKCKESYKHKRLAHNDSECPNHSKDEILNWIRAVLKSLEQQKRENEEKMVKKECVKYEDEKKKTQAKQDLLQTKSELEGFKAKKTEQEKALINNKLHNEKELNQFADLTERISKQKNEIRRLEEHKGLIVERQVRCQFEIQKYNDQLQAITRYKQPNKAHKNSLLENIIDSSYNKISEKQKNLAINLKNTYVDLLKIIESLEIEIEIHNYALSRLNKHKDSILTTDCVLKIDNSQNVDLINKNKKEVLETKVTFQKVKSDLKKKIESLNLERTKIYKDIINLKNELPALEENIRTDELLYKYLATELENIEARKAQLNEINKDLFSKEKVWFKEDIYEGRYKEERKGRFYEKLDALSDEINKLRDKKKKGTENEEIIKEKKLSQKEEEKKHLKNQIEKQTSKLEKEVVEYNKRYEDKEKMKKATLENLKQLKEQKVKIDKSIEEYEKNLECKESSIISKTKKLGLAIENYSEKIGKLNEKYKKHQEEVFSKYRNNIASLRMGQRQAEFVNIVQEITDQVGRLGKNIEQVTIKQVLQKGDDDSDSIIKSVNLVDELKEELRQLENKNHEFNEKYKSDKEQVKYLHAQITTHKNQYKQIEEAYNHGLSKLRIDLANKTISKYQHSFRDLQSDRCQCYFIHETNGKEDHQKWYDREELLTSKEIDKIVKGSIKYNVDQPLDLSVIKSMDTLIKNVDNNQIFIPLKSYNNENKSFKTRDNEKGSGNVEGLVTALKNKTCIPDENSDEYERFRRWLENYYGFVLKKDCDKYNEKLKSTCEMYKKDLLNYYEDQIFSLKKKKKEKKKKINQNSNSHKDALNKLESSQTEFLEKLFKEYKDKENSIYIASASSKLNEENKREILELSDNIETLRYEIKNYKDSLKIFEWDQYDFIKELSKELEEITPNVEKINDLVEYEAKRLKILHEKVRKEFSYLKEQKKYPYKLLENALDEKLMLLCGFDRYENKKTKLSPAESLIAVLVSNMIGQLNLYHKGGVNFVTNNEEEINGFADQAVKLYQKYRKDHIGSKVDDIQKILDLVNDEYSADNKIIEVDFQRQRFQTVSSQDTSLCKKQKIKLQLYQNFKGLYFSIHSIDKYRFDQEDPVLDLELKIQYLSDKISERINNSRDLNAICDKQLKLLCDNNIVACSKEKLQEIYNKRAQEIIAKDSVLDLRDEIFSKKEHKQDDCSKTALYVQLEKLDTLEEEIVKNKRDINVEDFYRLQKERDDRLTRLKQNYLDGLYQVIEDELKARKIKSMIVEVKKSLERQLLECDIEQLKLKQQISTIEVSISEKRSTLKELENIKAKNNVKSSENDKKTKEELEKLENLLKNAQSDLSGIQKEKSELEAKIQKLSEDLSSSRKELKVDEKEIEKIEQELESKRTKKLQKQNELADIKKDGKVAELLKRNTETELKEEESKLQHSLVWCAFINVIQRICTQDDVFSKRREILKKTDLKDIIEALSGEREITKEIENLIQKDSLYSFIKTLTIEEIQRQLHEIIEKPVKHTFAIESNSGQGLDKVVTIARKSLGVVEISYDSDLRSNESIKKLVVNVSNGSTQDIYEKIRDDVLEKIKAKSDVPFKFRTDRGEQYLTASYELQNTASSFGGTGLLDTFIKIDKAYASAHKLDLATLINTRIGIKYKQSEREAVKTSKFDEAIKALGKLKITVGDISRAFIDEIEIIADGKLFYDTDSYFPGVSLTIRARDLHFGKGSKFNEKVNLKTRGRDGEAFVDMQAEAGKDATGVGIDGEPGAVGVSGDHGMPGGNVNAKVDNKITGLETLEKIDVKGGNARRGQLGGSGGKGGPGKEGVQGKRRSVDENCIQSIITKASPNEEPGLGGDAGFNGADGKPGKTGLIIIEAKNLEIANNEIREGIFLVKISQIVSGDGMLWHSIDNENKIVDKTNQKPGEAGEAKSDALDTCSSNVPQGNYNYWDCGCSKWCKPEVRHGYFFDEVKQSYHQGNMKYFRKLDGWTYHFECERQYYTSDTSWSYDTRALKSINDTEIITLSYKGNWAHGPCGLVSPAYYFAPNTACKNEKEQTRRKNQNNANNKNQSKVRQGGTAPHSLYQQKQVAMSDLFQTDTKLDLAKMNNENAKGNAIYKTIIDQMQVKQELLKSTIKVNQTKIVRANEQKDICNNELMNINSEMFQIEHRLNACKQKHDQLFGQIIQDDTELGENQLQLNKVNSDINDIEMRAAINKIKASEERVYKTKCAQYHSYKTNEINHYTYQIGSELEKDKQELNRLLANVKELNDKRTSFLQEISCAELQTLSLDENEKIKRVKLQKEKITTREEVRYERKDPLGGSHPQLLKMVGVEVDEEILKEYPSKMFKKINGELGSLSIRHFLRLEFDLKKYFSLLSEKINTGKLNQTKNEILFILSGEKQKSVASWEESSTSSDQSKQRPELIKLLSFLKSECANDNDVNAIKYVLQVIRSRQTLKKPIIIDEPRSKNVEKLINDYNNFYANLNNCARIKSKGRTNSSYSVSFLYNYINVNILIEARIKANDLEYLKKNGGIIVQGDRGQNVKILDAQSIDDNDQSFCQYIKLLQEKIQSASRDCKYRHMFLPLQVQGHWITVHVDITGSHALVYVYDSLNCSTLLYTLRNEDKILCANRDVYQIQQDGLYCGGYVARLIANLTKKIATGEVFTNITEDMWGAGNNRDLELRAEDNTLVEYQLPSKIEEYCKTEELVVLREFEEEMQLFFNLKKIYDATEKSQELVYHYELTLEKYGLQLIYKKEALSTVKFTELFNKNIEAKFNILEKVEKLFKESAKKFQSLLKEAISLLNYNEKLIDADIKELSELETKDAFEEFILRQQYFKDVVVVRGNSTPANDNIALPLHYKLNEYEELLDKKLFTNLEGVSKEQKIKLSYYLLKLFASIEKKYKNNNSNKEKIINNLMKYIEFIKDNVLKSSKADEFLAKLKEEAVVTEAASSGAPKANQYNKVARIIRNYGPGFSLLTDHYEAILKEFNNKAVGYIPTKKDIEGILVQKNNLGAWDQSKIQRLIDAVESIKLDDFDDLRDLEIIKISQKIMDQVCNIDYIRLFKDYLVVEGSVKLTLRLVVERAIRDVQLKLSIENVENYKKIIEALKVNIEGLRSANVPSAVHVASQEVLYSEVGWLIKFVIYELSSVIQEINSVALFRALKQPKTNFYDLIEISKKLFGSKVSLNLKRFNKLINIVYQSSSNMLNSVSENDMRELLKLVDYNTKLFEKPDDGDPIKGLKEDLSQTQTFYAKACKLYGSEVASTTSDNIDRNGLSLKGLISQRVINLKNRIIQAKLDKLSKIVKFQDDKIIEAIKSVVDLIIVKQFLGDSFEAREKNIDEVTDEAKKIAQEQADDQGQSNNQLLEIIKDKKREIEKQYLVRLLKGKSISSVNIIDLIVDYENYAKDNPEIDKQLYLEQLEHCLKLDHEFSDGQTSLDHGASSRANASTSVAGLSLDEIESIVDRIKTFETKNDKSYEEWKLLKCLDQYVDRIITRNLHNLIDNYQNKDKNLCDKKELIEIKTKIITSYKNTLSLAADDEVNKQKCDFIGILLERLEDIKLSAEGGKYTPMVKSVFEDINTQIEQKIREQKTYSKDIEEDIMKLINNEVLCKLQETEITSLETAIKKIKNLNKLLEEFSAEKYEREAKGNCKETVAVNKNRLEYFLDFLDTLKAVVQYLVFFDKSEENMEDVLDDLLINLDVLSNGDCKNAKLQEIKEFIIEQSQLARFAYLEDSKDIHNIYEAKLLKRQSEEQKLKEFKSKIAEVVICNRAANIAEATAKNLELYKHVLSQFRREIKDYNLSLPENNNLNSIQEIRYTEVNSTEVDGVIEYLEKRNAEFIWSFKGLENKQSERLKNSLDASAYIALKNAKIEEYYNALSAIKEQRESEQNQTFDKVIFVINNLREFHDYQKVSELIATHWNNQYFESLLLLQKVTDSVEQVLKLEYEDNKLENIKLHERLLRFNFRIEDELNLGSNGIDLQKNEALNRLLYAFAEQLNSRVEYGGSFDVRLLAKVMKGLLKTSVYKKYDVVEKLQAHSINDWLSIIIEEGYRDSLPRSYCQRLLDALSELSEKDKKLAKELIRLFGEKCKNKSVEAEQSMSIDLIRIVEKSISGEFVLSMDIIKDINVSDWYKTIQKYSNEQRKSHNRTLSDLLAMMADKNKVKASAVNSGIKNLVSGADNKVNKLFQDIQSFYGGVINTDFVETNAKRINACRRFVKDWNRNDIKIWSKKLLGGQRDNCFDWNKETLPQIMAVIIRAVKINFGYHPRDTQLLALALFLSSDATQNDKKGRLGQVYTGEGKTLITAMLAIAQGIIGEKVDIVTSSKVLAERETKDEKLIALYNIFNLKVVNNCDEEAENPGDIGKDTRRKRYKEANIVYGDTSSFERDILLTKFFGDEIRSDSGQVGGIAGIKNNVANSLVLDEVDSMLLDNSSKTLYLSHSIVDFRWLRDVFVHIWNMIHAPDVQDGGYQAIDNVCEGMQKLLEDDIVALPGQKTMSQLRAYVNRNLKVWIKNAYKARIMMENDHYIIGDKESGKFGEVIPIAKDTGVEQLNTNWSNGLTQFIQLKHSLKLSDETLKAVFISNVNFFKLYSNVNGMTGTIGENKERALLNRVYKLDFFEIPRFRQSQYIQERGIVCGDKSNYYEEILKDIEEKNVKNQDNKSEHETKLIDDAKERLKKELESNKSKKPKKESLESDQRRAILVICDNISEVETIKNYIDGKFSKKNENYKSKIIVYDRAYNELKEEDKLVNPGDIIIATNIAGRGTDLKTSDLLEINGGLHVILTYVPINLRIEEQAFGRTARKGNKGTGKFIVYDSRKEYDDEISISYLRAERDRNEILALEAMEYRELKSVELEGELFNKFNDLNREIKWSLKSKYRDEAMYELQLANLKNHWALWLSEMEKSINQSYKEEYKKNVLEQYDKFVKNTRGKLNSSYALIEEPIELTKLGYLYFSKGHHCKAREIFTEVIKAYPKFSAQAHYYKGMATIGGGDGGKDNRRECKAELKEAKLLLEEERTKISNRQQTIKMLHNVYKQTVSKGGTPDLFSLALEEESNLILQHINAIENTIGSRFSKESLKSGLVYDDKLTFLFEHLVKRNEITKDYRVSKKLKIEGEKIVYKGKEIEYPEDFEYNKDKVINLLNKKGDYKSRNLKKNAFKDLVFSKEKFKQILKDKIKKIEIIKLKDISKLQGKLDAEIFHGKGDEVIRIIRGDAIKIEGKEYRFLPDEQVQHVASEIRRDVFEKYLVDAIGIQDLHKSDVVEYLGPKLMVIIPDKIEIPCEEIGVNYDRNKVKEILENYRSSNHEKKSLFAKLSKIQKNDKKIEKILKAFGCTFTQKDGVLKIEEEYQYVGSNIQELELLVDTIELNDNIIFEKVENLALGEALENVKVEIKALIKEKFQGRKIIRRDFITKLVERLKEKGLQNEKQEEHTEKDIGYKFDILREILRSQNMLKISLYQKLGLQADDDFKEPLEDKLITLVKLKGRLTINNLNLRDSIEESEKLWSYFHDAGIIKDRSVKLKIEASPLIDKIEAHIENAVKEILKLKVQEEWHDWINPFEDLTKGEDEAKKYVNDIVEHVKNTAGTLRIYKKVKLEYKSLEEFFSDGHIPPAVLDYANMLFVEAVHLVEKKEFVWSWDAFWCMLIGLAQICLGVALAVCTFGGAAVLSEMLISEGIGDAVFAIQAQISGDFSWKKYTQHKVMSLAITITTMGVGKLLQGAKQTVKVAQAAEKAAAKSANIAAKRAGKRALAAIISGKIALNLVKVGSQIVISKAADLSSELIMDGLINDKLDSKLVEIGATLESEAKRVKIKTLMEKLYQMSPSNAANIIKQATDETFNKIRQGDICSKIINQIERISEVFARAKSYTGKRALVVCFMNNAAKAANVVKAISEIALMYQIFYDKLINRLEENCKSIESTATNSTLGEQDNQDIDKRIKDIDKDLVKEIKIVAKQNLLNKAISIGLNKLHQKTTGRLLDKGMALLDNTIQAHHKHKAEQLLNSKKPTSKSNRDFIRRMGIANEINNDEQDRIKNNICEHKFENIKDCNVLAPDQINKARIFTVNRKLYLLYDHPIVYKEHVKKVIKGEIAASTAELQAMHKGNGGVRPLHIIEEGTQEFAKIQLLPNEKISALLLKNVDGSKHYVAFVNGIEVDVKPDANDLKCGARALSFILEYDKAIYSGKTPEEALKRAGKIVTNEQNLSNFMKDYKKAALSNKQFKEAYKFGLRNVHKDLIGGNRIVTFSDKTTTNIEKWPKGYKTGRDDIHIRHIIPLHGSNGTMGLNDIAEELWKKSSVELGNIPFEITSRQELINRLNLEPNNLFLGNGGVNSSIGNRSIDPGLSIDAANNVRKFLKDFSKAEDKKKLLIAEKYFKHLSQKKNFFEGVTLAQTDSVKSFKESGSTYYSYSSSKAVVRAYEKIELQISNDCFDESGTYDAATNSTNEPINQTPRARDAAKTVEKNTT